MDASETSRPLHVSASPRPNSSIPDRNEDGIDKSVSMWELVVITVNSCISFVAVQIAYSLTLNSSPNTTRLNTRPSVSFEARPFHDSSDERLSFSSGGYVSGV